MTLRDLATLYPRAFPWAVTLFLLSVLAGLGFVIEWLWPVEPERPLSFAGGSEADDV